MGLLQPHGGYGRGDGQTDLILFGSGAFLRDAPFSSPLIHPVEAVMSSFHTLDSADLKGKRVLVRVDLNVPMENGKVSDATRIERVAPTITEIADKGGKVILLAHFGRPKGRDLKESLKPVTADVAHV